MGLASTLILWLAVDLRFLPNADSSQSVQRHNFGETVASNAVGLIEDQDAMMLQKLVNLAVAQNSEIQSVGILGPDGSYLAKTTGHAAHWAASSGADRDRVMIDVVKNRQAVGKVEVLYLPVSSSGFWGVLQYPFSLLLFFGCASTLVCWFLIEQMFKYLNPINVIPLRVRSALDNLAEGLVFVEPSGTIIYANQAFGKLFGEINKFAVGSKIADLRWSFPDETVANEFPWIQCQLEQRAVCGVVVELELDNCPKKYRVNASPIFTNDSKKLRGVLVSFDDVTSLQNKKAELGEIVQTLRKSRDEIARQNEKLQFLANYDHLTNCFNRRSFWAQYEELWKMTPHDKLSIIMIDIDKFKLINDRYGHAAGDEVLEATGTLLRDVVGRSGSVFRYGGEEFAVLLPDLDVEEAAGLAWGIHEKFQSQKHVDLDITASLGLSNRSFGAMDLQHMLDQADQCLYAAKRKGRNTVVRFDKCQDLQPVSSVDEIDDTNLSANIEYSTVTGLLSALAFRCQATAEHSMRVSDLSVAIGRNLLTKRNLYRLEICALLHDIGKIGVPDAILHKPGELTPEEWEVMQRHDEIAVEIIRSSFASEEVAQIIQSHRREYSTDPEVNSTDGLRPIPLESRIIAVCDAFDSMIYDHVYRRGISAAEAVRELQRCSPEQFDPNVVELLADYVESPTFKNTWSAKVADSNQVENESVENPLDRLCEAIDAADVGEIREALRLLKIDAEQSGSPVVSTATRKLDEAIADHHIDFDQIGELASEVLQHCRTERHSAGTPVGTALLTEVASRPSG